MARLDHRKSNELRTVKLSKDCNKYAEGSCLIEFGGGFPPRQTQ